MRRAPRRTPAALAAGTLLLAVSACAGPVRVEQAPATGDLGGDEAACDALLEALPDEVDGLAERDVEPGDVAARAWGEPAVVVVCGASMPPEFTETSPCFETEAGVQWYVDERTASDQESDAVLTTIGFEPIVQLRVPAEHRPPFGVFADVDPAIVAHAELVDRCA